MEVSIHKSHFLLENNFQGYSLLSNTLLIVSFILEKKVVLENSNVNEFILDVLEKLGLNYFISSDHTLYIKDYQKKTLDTLEIKELENPKDFYLLIPLVLNYTKRIIFNNVFKINLSFYQDLLDNCNLSINTNNNKIIVSGSINLDYYQCDDVPIEFIIGLVFNALKLKKAITIKSNLLTNETLLNTLETLRKYGFDYSINDNYLYIHNNPIYLKDFMSVETNYLEVFPYLVLASLNGSALITTFKENSFLKEKRYLNLLIELGSNIKYLEDKTLYIANNKLLEKGVRQPLKGFEYDLTLYYKISYYLLVLASFAKGYSNFYHLDKLNNTLQKNLLLFCDTLKELNVNLTIKDNIITIKGQSSYFNQKVITNIKNDNMLKALCIFGLLNEGSLTILNIEKIKDSNFLDLLIKATKKEAIAIKK